MENEKSILVVDDEEQIVNVVKAYLEKEGYKVFTAFSGKDAIDIFNLETIDFIVLDLMLPDLSGEEVCKKIRVKSQVPILMLTAKVEEGDRINGLNIGADDYMVKPFSPKELVARVRAILRRLENSNIKADIIEFNNGDLAIDFSKMEVRKKGKQIKLTPTEFKILSLLSKNIGKVFSREELINKALGFDFEGYDRTIDAHIKNIRHKIEDEKNKYIKTIYGVGYKFLGG
ncbi:response regulator transcription factor [Thermohalobacter berrensis]|uniref:DNA-binding response regulator n=1 Tax=Thermohalobacter berrensis TaxID=99594 RepID=A0A419SZK7_9FIRM|nr:response regulator transcription factor [Thermohalobacter berrensis]RKD30608.1 DNA-binding response regulator [Thermohalobacter berrensis]